MNRNFGGGDVSRMNLMTVAQSVADNVSKSTVRIIASIFSMIFGKKFICPPPTV